MKKKLSIVIIVLIGLSLAVWKWRTPSVLPQTEAVWVKASQVQKASLAKEVHAVGTLVARSVEIVPEMAGVVEKIFFQDGSFVKQGTPLIQLNDAIYRVKYASAEAKYTYSLNQFKRLSLLNKKGMISTQALDQAEAELKEKKAEMDEAKVNLEKMKLIAPFDGVIGKSKINPGDFLNVGQGVVTLTDIQHLRIEYSIPEQYLAALVANQEVTVKSSAYPGKTFKAKLAFISPTINTDNRSVSLYAELPNPEQLLKSGMFVDVNHSLGQDEEALLIPERSLVPMLNGEQVYKVVNGKAYASFVKIGKRQANYVQIIQGISAGDLIITDGQHKLKNGIPVKLKS